jgi:hypothetical protein
MEKRRFNIEIFKWAKDWWITLEGFDFDKQDEYQPLDKYYGFAKHGITDDKKVAYLFSNGLHNIDIKELADEKIFNESLHFTAFVDEKEESSFDGTLVNALKYIKKALDNE